MKGRKERPLIRIIITVLVASALMMGLSIGTKGMYLMGVPSIKDVQRVSIAYPAVTDEIKEITDPNQIELAVKLTGFLRYSLFEKSDEETAPLITITYFLNDGESVSVSASRSTVWWKGKKYAIKEPEIFVNLTEGIFFMEDVANR